MSYLKKLCSRTHWEICKINKAAEQYCLKEETRISGPWSFGERPKVNQNADSVKAAKTKRAEANREIHEKGPLAALQEGLIGYKDYRNVRIARDLIELDS